jgi:peptide subunit release factor 1 (eRF1)
MPSLDQLSAQLDRLAAFESGPFPVITLYLNLQPNQVGRDNFAPFLRKELTERLRTYPASGPERESLQKDAERIRAHVESVDPSINGLVIFASSGAGLFEAIEVAAPIDQHRMFISDQPHLYPLARLLDTYPRFAALVADTNSARIFVFAANQLERTHQIEGTKTRRHKMGGWSQARYQRHVENYHLHHAKEIADALARLVRDEDIGSVVIAGDEVITPLLTEQLPKEVSDRIVDVVKLDVRAPEREVLDSAIAALREQDARNDREKVEAMIGAYRANGLGVVGVEETRRALEMGQVDELIITATPAAIDAGAPHAGDVQPERSAEERAADELVGKARQTAAKIRFIEDAELLREVGGVGALLRFRV